MGAYLIDALILTAIVLVAGGVVVAIALGLAQVSDALGIAIGVLGGLVVLAAALLYAPYFMKRPGNRNGQTLGKQVVNIRVVRVGGEPVDFGWAALREIAVKGLLVGVVNTFTFGLATLVDFLSPLWHGENRALHDFVVSSRVVTE